VLDYCKIGEMLLKAISEMNQVLAQIASPYRLQPEFSEAAYEIYMAKKNNGFPKDDYPSKFSYTSQFY